MTPRGECPLRQTRRPQFNSPNDIVVKSDGSIWWRDPNGGLFNIWLCDFDIQKCLGFQGVFRVAPDGSGLALVTDDDFENPNGLCLDAMRTRRRGPGAAPSRSNRRL